MSYDNGISFGYDQLFVNPASENYSYFQKENKTPLSDINNNFTNKNNYDEDLLRKMFNTNNTYDTRLNDSYNFENYYKEKNYENLKSLNPKSKDFINETNEMKNIINNLQQKNDMFLIFIVFLCIFVVLQYTNNSKINYILPSYAQPANNFAQPANNFAPSDVKPL